MSRPPARSATAPSPHTRKRPDRCAHCGSRDLSRKGTRSKKFETVQLWRCRGCRRVFTPAPAALRNKTYPLRVILDALTWYDLGYTLNDTRAKLKARYGLSVAASSITGWFAEHKELTSYRRLRSSGMWLYPPPQTVRAIKLYHRQVYHFAYHRSKLALLRESREHRRFASLADFLEDIPKTCPHALFQDGARASQLRASPFHPTRAIVSEKENFATRTAAFVLPTIGDNARRHETLQRFMLANDSVTLAVEVPIWLSSTDINEIEARYRIRLRAQDDIKPITGHIDFLQVRNGAVHILDYKPNARGDRPIAQLAIYALAISKLTGIKLFDIKCAWFDDNHYCEFFPRKLLSK
jgi:hypothetical protein